MSNIEGVKIFEIPVYEDERGWFKESFNLDRERSQGLPEEFVPVQNNVSFNCRGATRGIHAEPWNKYISLASGLAFIALVDLRPEGFGQVMTMQIDPKTGVYIPAGVGNSFQSLEDGTAYNYLVDDYWSADKEYKMVNLLDQELAIEWPIPAAEAVISEKDKTHPSLEQVRSNK